MCDVAMLQCCLHSTTVPLLSRIGPALYLILRIGTLETRFLAVSERLDGGCGPFEARDCPGIGFHRTVLDGGEKPAETFGKLCKILDGIQAPPHCHNAMLAHLRQKHRVGTSELCSPASIDRGTGGDQR